MITAPIPANRAAAGPSGDTQTALAERFARTRALTAALIQPLSAEDCVVQSMPDASPAKWHLAHTSWFFEQFLLGPHLPGYRVFDEQFSYLFNSYYDSVGPRHQRPERGLLTRPALAEVMAYRTHVDAMTCDMVTRASDAVLNEVAAVVELGIQHEQQHQELLLMDMKHLLSRNPLKPGYQLRAARHGAARHSASVQAADNYRAYPEGIYEIGHQSAEFCFDNEMPRHRTYLGEFALAQRLVNNGEYLEFIRDRGYERVELWLADGWTLLQTEQWRRPLYWSESLDAEFTLSGMQTLDPNAPVCHVSFYEAEAFAHWAQARLPTEQEWEVAANREPVGGNFLEDGMLHPVPPARGATQFFGDVWEWTRSAYSPYPGFKPLTGALGEYNGKFMCNQFVLRGGCCVTPRTHIRPTYRNYFYPRMRWQFSGIRLAKETRP